MRRVIVCVRDPRNRTYTRFVARQHTILLVDDESSILDLWTRALITAGYNVIRAADALEAFERLEFHPTVAVCDVRMPGASGLWLAGMIRERSPDTAIVLATGDPCLPPAETLRPGIVAYILKPTSNDDLLAAIERGIVWSEHQRREA